MIISQSICKRTIRCILKRKKALIVQDFFNIHFFALHFSGKASGQGRRSLEPWPIKNIFDPILYLITVIVLTMVCILWPSESTASCDTVYFPGFVK